MKELWTNKGGKTKRFPRTWTRWGVVAPDGELVVVAETRHYANEFRSIDEKVVRVTITEVVKGVTP